MVTFWGYYGFNNLGDDLMLEKCLSMIQDDNIKVYGGFQNSYKINNAEFIRLRGISGKLNFLHDILKSDRLIWGGGTCFYKEENTPIMPLVFMMLVCLFSRIVNTKVYFIGVGIGTLSGLLSCIICKIIFMLSTKLIFRDKQSLSLAGKKFNTQATLGSDIVYTVGNMNNTQDIGVLTISGHYAYCDEGFLNNFYDVVAYLMELKKINSIKFIPMHTGAYGDDNDFHRLLEIRIRKEFPSISISYVEDDFVNGLSNAELHLGLRLHSIMISILNNVKVIPFTYSKKINYFLESIIESPVIFTNNSKINLQSIQKVINTEVKADSIQEEINKAKLMLNELL